MQRRRRTSARNSTTLDSHSLMCVARVRYDHRAFRAEIYVHDACQIAKLTVKLTETLKPLPDLKTVRWGVVSVPRSPSHVPCPTFLRIPRRRRRRRPLNFINISFSFDRHRSRRADDVTDWETITELQRPHGHHDVPSRHWVVPSRDQTTRTAHARPLLVLFPIWHQHIRGYEGAFVTGARRVEELNTVNHEAYLGPDGKARLFRPEMNMRRLERSMARMALPVSEVAPLPMSAFASIPVSFFVVVMASSHASDSPSTVTASST